MEDKLIYSQTFLQNKLLLENIQGGIVYSDYDPPFYLRYVTEGMAQMSGYTQEELLDMVQMDLVHPDDEAHVVSEVNEQFAKGDTFSVEYRLKKKDNTYVYVLDRAKVVAHEDGNKYIHCLLTDITEIKEMEQALLLSEEKYKIAMQQNGNIILEYDPEKDHIKFSDNHKEIFGHTYGENMCWSAFIQTGRVYEEDIQLLEESMDNLLSKKENTAMDIRLWNVENKLIWYSLKMSSVATTNGRIYAVVGSLQNINQHKIKIEKLTELLEKDYLTDVYSRATMERLVGECLREKYLNNSALMIMDIDYFKQVNDINGHDYGDEILISVANTIQKMLPDNAILGRLGGDEFLLFVYDAKNQENICQLVESIVSTVRETHKYETPPITVSFGIAMYTANDMNFKWLYRNADDALYHTKDAGRDGFFVFVEERE